MTAPSVRDASVSTGWTALILTASSERQAEVYRGELQRRAAAGQFAAGMEWLVVPDAGGRRMGSGGATIQALGELTKHVGEALESWWAKHRVLMIHSGGDSRRLPQYSPSGKLFGRLPKAGALTTVFDEMLAASASWAERMPCGLLVAAGDVVLDFDPVAVNWAAAGVTGVGMRQPYEVGARHGVYVADGAGTIYGFLQKPTEEQVRAAGGMLEGGRVLLDTGLLRFDAEAAARLTEMAEFRTLPEVDLYQHVTRLLTREWTPEAGAGVFWRQLSQNLRGLAFQCAAVDGEFTHIGTTRAFRSVAAAAGGVLDSVLAEGAELSPGAVVLECELAGKVRVRTGAVLHGLCGIGTAVEVPEDTVVHQVPVRRQDGRHATVIRVYGVADDPKVSAGATWFGRPIEAVLEELGIAAERVWPGGGERSLWNANLFPAADVETAWRSAQWLMGDPGTFSAAEWARQEVMSLASSAALVDAAALQEGHARRMRAQWERSVVELAEAGADVRPLAANAPGVAALASAARALERRGEALEESPEGTTIGPELGEAASRFVQASVLWRRGGAPARAAAAEQRGFQCIERMITGSNLDGEREFREWAREGVVVSAAPRLDLGGGWSDTPPFCLDWGGTVLNLAFAEGGVEAPLPIRTEVRRLDEPVIRCVSEGTGESAEFRTTEDLRARLEPGSPFTIPRTALRLAGFGGDGESLDRALERAGGGLEIRMQVKLPIGSGLGTSSILSATVVRALRAMSGVEASAAELSDEVMRLEQLMTTGGGWQDQAGAIFPGAKLLITGPGMRQKIRVIPAGWSAEVQADFCRHLVVYYTGLQRVAKNLLKQVVGSYLARETATVQVLHSIKTLAMEMSYALAEGEWAALGGLLNRHWRLNQILDPHTTNAPINALLERVRPYVYGAKLAGAGGGGYLMMLARDVEAAGELRSMLGAPEVRVVNAGLVVESAAAARPLRHRRGSAQ